MSLYSLQLVKRCWLGAGIGFLSLLLSSCEPRLPAQDATQPLPIELQVNPKPDSVFTLSSKPDFSSVSKVGQGPSGSLIRWNILGAPHNNYTAYTYDQQGRLVGTCEHTSFDYDELRLVRYQGAYLAQVYTAFDHSASVSNSGTIDIGFVSKYEYDAQHRLGQVLVYEKVGDSLKLNQTVEYAYTADGQLLSTRHTVSLAFGSLASYQGVYPTEVCYWENSDVYRSEIYTPNQPPVKPNSRVFYNQVINPRARLHLWPQNQITQHYPIGSGVTSPDIELFQYQYSYDAQGRLSNVQQRSVIDYYGSNTHWTDWSYKEEFVYAP